MLNMCMNKYLVHIISATRLQVVLIAKQAKNGHWHTKQSVSLCLRTSGNHMEYQSLICMRKASFYIGNTTSAFLIVLFSINCSWKFALSLRCVVILNCKLCTTQNQQHCFGITGNRSIYLHYTAAIWFFFSEVCEKL